MGLIKSKMDFTEELLAMPPFSINRVKKEELLLRSMSELTQLHELNCLEYGRILKHLNKSRNWDYSSLTNIPFLPVRIFKHLELRSVPGDEIFKVMSSSGTSGQIPSKIYLDRVTAKLQSVILSKIFSDFIPMKRPPILVIDSADTIKNRRAFSARAAGILGFSFLCRDMTFALKSDMTLDDEAVINFAKKYKNETVVIFGFTSIVWEYLLNNKDVHKFQSMLHNSYVVHGGGWKKLESLQINSSIFKTKVREVIGTSNVINYYGLVEQTGSLYFECQEGFLHSSNYSNIIVREERNFLPVSDNTIGLLQLQSILPKSYPGHSILTEDLGAIIGVDDCPCGRLGQRFQVIGRIPDAEIRGCSDTHEY